MKRRNEKVNEIGSEPLHEEAFRDEFRDEIFATSGPAVKAHYQRLPATVIRRPTLRHRAEPGNRQIKDKISK